MNSYRDVVEEQWSEKWWNWIMKYKDVEKYTIDSGYAAIGGGQDRLDWDYLAQNQNTSLKIIKANLAEFLDEGYRWSFILQNPNMTSEFIKEHIHEINPFNSNWHTCLILAIDPEFIKNNPQYPWNYEEQIDEIKRKRNEVSIGYSFKQIDESNPENVDWQDVSWDTFNQERRNYIVQEYRRYLAAFRIQHWWKKLKVIND